MTQWAPAQTQGPGGHLHHLPLLSPPSHTALHPGHPVHPLAGKVGPQLHVGPFSCPLRGFPLTFPTAPLPSTHPLFLKPPVILGTRSSFLGPGGTHFQEPSPACPPPLMPSDHGRTSQAPAPGHQPRPCRATAGMALPGPCLASSLMPAVPGPTHLCRFLPQHTHLPVCWPCFQARLWLPKGGHRVVFKVPVMLSKWVDRQHLENAQVARAMT